MSGAEGGLRERRKQRTRQWISDVATRLFIAHGFDQVTIAEVAAAAEVAKMTVTNHFPRKEDLVFDVHEELIAGPARAVSERRPGESALDALRRGYFDALARQDAVLGFAGIEFVELITGSPTLRARLREIHEAREEALAAVLAQESAEDASTVRAVAAQLCATDRALFHEVLRHTLRGAGHDEIAAIMAESAPRVFDLLESGVGGYARRAER